MPFSFRKTGFFLFTTLLMLVCSSYVAWIIIWPLPSPIWLRVVLIAIFFCSAQAISLVRYLISSRPDLPFQKLRFFGFSSSMFMLLVGVGLIRDFLWFLVLLCEVISGHILAADFLHGSLVNLLIVSCCAASAGIGCLIAYQMPLIRILPVKDENLPPQLDGLRILHATDLHIGSNKARHWAQKCVDLINANQPDLILISGDLADGMPGRLKAEIQPLANLRAQHGVFACLGNHEYYAGADQWTIALRGIGMIVLVNDFRILVHKGATLVVAGIADTCAEEYAGQVSQDPQGVREKLPEGYSFLLCHRPADVNLHAELGYNFQFSGHTHGGQFPLMFPLVNYLNSNYRKGLYRQGKMWLHVGQGSGFWGYVPMRLLTRPEFTEIVLSRD